jgi:molybdopterin biosynthesis enzyme
MSTAAAKARPDWMPPEAVPLLDSMHRVLREDVFCDADSPPFDKAIRDGFAVRFEDVAQVPAVLKVIGESRAGAGADVVVTPSEVLRNHDRCAVASGRQCCGEWSKIPNAYRRTRFAS